jgi:hypothetical protein
MIASYILTLDTGDDTDLFGIAKDVREMIDGNEGLLVVDCKPFPHPTLNPTPPPGAPPGPNLLAGS